MRFQCEYQVDASVATDIDPTDGSLSPPWADLDMVTQNVIISVTDGLSATLGVLAATPSQGIGTPESQQYLVMVSGYVNESVEDTTKTSITTGINQGQAKWES